MEGGFNAKKNCSASFHLCTPVSLRVGVLVGERVRDAVRVSVRESAKQDSTKKNTCNKNEGVGKKGETKSKHKQKRK